MASVVEICNRALQKVGSKRITSLTQDSAAARACNVAYDPVRLALLRSHRWNFSILRATLAASSTTPDWGRANEFPLPSDFLYLAPDYPEDNVNSKDWQIEGRSILTNDGDPLYLRYVADIEDPNTMDPLFREALSANLALEICEELTQSNTKQDALQKGFDKIIARAKHANAIENQPTDAYEDTWLSERQ